MLAIADEGKALLQATTQAELTRLGEADPVVEFRTRGVAFVLFAAEYPVHFQLLYSRDVRSLQKGNVCTEAELDALLSREPNLRADAVRVSLAGQCLAYGLARMIVDDELPELPRDKAILREFVESILDVMGSGLAQPPSKQSP